MEDFSKEVEGSIEEIIEAIKEHSNADEILLSVVRIQIKNIVKGSLGAASNLINNQLKEMRDNL